MCSEAREFDFAAVCVNPAWVAQAAEALGGASSQVCTVVSFPLGAAAADVKVFEAQRAVADGATEIDMVMNIGALKSGNLDLVTDEITRVVLSCRGRALVKVILEVALLTEAEKVSACLAAKSAGAAYVKTSTGFGPGGATAADVALLRRTVGDSMGVKAAGGIRDLETVRILVAAGATRIGTSSGVAIAREAGKAGQIRHATP